MSETVSGPPWVWNQLPSAERRRRWQALVTWVEWLEEAYQPWVVLPACWPAHEGLRAELTLFWYWHGWLSTSADDPAAGVRWHAELRRAAEEWRRLAACDHRPPGPERERVMAARRTRRDTFIPELTEKE